MCPYYYDFKYQYKLLVKKIESIDFMNIESMLNKCIETGYINMKNGKSIHSVSQLNRFKLHPKEIANLKTILNKKIMYLNERIVFINICTAL